MGEGGSNDVYIRSDEFAWIPARLVEQDKTTAKVAIPQYESEELIMSDGGKGAVGFKSAIVKLSDYVSNVLPLQNVNSSGTLREVDDMVDLTFLHEVSCLITNSESLSLLITELLATASQHPPSLFTDFILFVFHIIHRFRLQFYTT